MNQQTARHVIFHYTRFMNAQEQRAWSHVIAADKAESYRTRKDITEEKRDKIVLRISAGLSTDPKVLQLISEGGEAFFENTASRILRDHGSEISLNRCPRCGEVTVTPKSKQCRYCRHDWHD